MASLRLNEEMETRLSHLANITGRTKTFYIRKLIEDNIDQLEDRYFAEHQQENPANDLSGKNIKHKAALNS